MRRTLFAFMTTTFVALTLCTSNAGATTIDFDGMNYGDAVGTIDGVTFSLDGSSPSAGLTLMVSSGFETSSMPNYLGVQGNGSDFFQPGDIVNLLFATSIVALDVTFIGPPGMPDGAYGVSTGATTVSSSSANLIVLGSGDEAFTLHLEPGGGFTSASLFGDAFLAPAFSIDDIVTNDVPEPATVTLMLAPLVGLARSRWRSRSRRG